MEAGFGKTVVGIVAVNSCDFVALAIRCLNEGKTFVSLRNEHDQERIELVGAASVIAPGSTTGWLESPAYEPSNSLEIAQIQFTSGTEGRSKPILLSHAALANSTYRLIDKMQMDASVREYVGVPVYYSFGFGRCRAVLQVGGSAYIPGHGFDPIEIRDMMERDEINAISAVPSLWRLVLQNPDLFIDVGAKLRWIEIGSQFMSATEKDELRTLFPYARIIQHYGLSEASRTTFLDISDASTTQLESVGQVESGVEVSINEDGRIQIRGPHVASAMLTDTGTESLTDKDGWFVTNDLGRLEDGYLYFEGRADDIINCAGIKISPDEVEASVHKTLGVTDRVTAAKIPDSVRGESVLIASLPGIDENTLRRAVESTLKGMGVEAGQSVKYFNVEEFPVTKTGKVRRKELAEQFLAAAPTTVSQAGEESNLQDPRVAELVALWEEVLQIKPVSPDDSFFDLGGDSLSAINVAIRMEKHGIPKDISRQIFEGKSISQIVDTSRTGNKREPLAAASQSVDAVRGMLALFVVASHWMPGVVERIPGISGFNSLFSFFYSAGTPGFAVIFGIGVGFAYLPRFQRSRKSVNSLVMRNALLLFAGIVFLALVKIAAGILGGEPMTPVDYSNTFYGVLTYYMLAVLSIPLWLSWLIRRQSLVISSLFLALTFYLIHELIVLWDPNPSENPIVQTGILLLTAKFNYFEISSGVLVGLAMGFWLRNTVTEQNSTGNSLSIGLLIMLAGFLLSVKFGHLQFWAIWPKPMFVWIWVLYAGFVLACTHGVFKLAMIEERNAIVDVSLKTMSIVGIMAFPLFIGHELVIPLKDLLSALGVPAALPMSIAAFFATMIYITVKVYRIYYPAKS